LIKPSAGRGSCRKSCKVSDGHLIERIQPSLRKARALMPLCGYWRRTRSRLSSYWGASNHNCRDSDNREMRGEETSCASWEPNTILHHAFGGCRCAESRLRGRQGSELEAKSDCGSIAANASEPATYSCCWSVGRAQVPQTNGSPNRGYSRGGSGVQSTDSRENRARRKAILQRPLIGGWNRSLQHVP
jgi:hypothetical protein